MTLDIREFRLAWRWTNPKYTVFPQSILDELIPLDESFAWELGKHLQAIFRGGEGRFISTTRHNADESGNAFLAGLGIADDTEVFVHWDDKTALITKWHVFSTYWDDFCYPSSDDVSVFPGDDSWLLFYDHKEIFYFGRQ